jgi:hypothetical protein
MKKAIKFVAKKNPLAVEFYSIGAAGKPDQRLARANLKVLHPESGWVAGPLLNESGQWIAKLEIDGFPQSLLAPETRPGRPRKDEKHLAVLLAWALKCWELGEKRTEADRQIAELFNYSEGGKVRKIRQGLSEEHGINFDQCFVVIRDPRLRRDGLDGPAMSALILEPTYRQTSTGGAEIIGAGTVWQSSFGECVSSNKVIKVDMPEVDGSFDALKERGGPIILLYFWPG